MKGQIKSFRIEAAVNGFTLEYCIKTKQPMLAGQTYQNTDYKEMEEVFVDKAALVKRVSELLNVVSAADGEQESSMPMSED